MPILLSHETMNRSKSTAY